MAVQFKPKPGKPHIKIRVSTTQHRYFLWPNAGDNELETDKAAGYCSSVNPGSYITPGEAARALHYGSANK